jgi:hypothetical protein
MSTEELNGEQAEVEEVVKTPEVEIEAPEGGEAEKKADKPQTNAELEALATEIGWDKTKSKTAAQWIRDGSVIQRDLKASKDAQARDFQQRLDRLDRTTKSALTHQREQIDAAWKIRMREAVNLADMEAFDKAQEGRDRALKKFDEGVEELPATKGKQPDDAPPEVKAFAKRNSWFDVDEDMTDVAVNISKRLASKYPDMPLDERLEQVEREIKRKFPNEFTSIGETIKTNGAKPPAVEGGLRPIKTSTAKGWAQLPPEAKEFADSLIKDGLFDKDPEKARAKYAAEYFSQPGA